MNIFYPFEHTHPFDPYHFSMAFKLSCASLIVFPPKYFSMYITDQSSLFIYGSFFKGKIYI